MVMPPIPSSVRTSLTASNLDGCTIASTFVIMILSSGWYSDSNPRCILAAPYTIGLFYPAFPPRGDLCLECHANRDRRPLLKPPAVQTQTVDNLFPVNLVPRRHPNTRRRRFQISVETSPWEF